MITRKDFDELNNCPFCNVELAHDGIDKYCPRTSCYNLYVGVEKDRVCFIRINVDGYRLISDSRHDNIIQTHIADYKSRHTVLRFYDFVLPKSFKAKDLKKLVHKILDLNVYS